MSGDSQTITQADPKRWKALALLGFANFMVMMDSAIIQVALPAIKETLGYSQENLQWVMTRFSYLLRGTFVIGRKTE